MSVLYEVPILAVDESKNISIMLLEARARIYSITVYVLYPQAGAGLRATYNVYPGGQSPLAYAGDRITVVVGLNNVGTGTGYLFMRVTDADTGEELGYMQTPDPVAPGYVMEIGPLLSKTMPPKNWNLIVEAGHV